MPNEHFKRFTPWILFLSFLLVFFTSSKGSSNSLIAENFVKPVEQLAKLEAKHHQEQAITPPFISRVASGKQLALSSIESILSNTSNSLRKRAFTIADDYTCGAGRPCKNGACCGSEVICVYVKLLF
jgi:hypothetical protein